MLGFCLSQGCTVTLIAAYDAETEQQVTSIQKSIEDFFAHQLHNKGGADAKYDACKSFYSDTEASLRVLATRVAAIPKNDQIANQVLELVGTIADLEKIHQKHPDGLEEVSIIPARNGIESVCGSILKLELAKKRGG
jgi:hypothetical protein